MTIGEIDGKGYKLGIARLHEVIVVAESYHKVNVLNVFGTVNRISTAPRQRFITGINTR